jgi:hypothetical protein
MAATKKCGKAAESIAALSHARIGTSLREMPGSWIAAERPIAKFRVDRNIIGSGKMS